MPADVAKGRVPAPVVEREKLFLATQRAKKDAEEALNRGDVAGARTMLDDAMGALSDAPPESLSSREADELTWLGTTRATLDRRGAGYTSKRLNADHARKSGTRAGSRAGRSTRATPRRRRVGRTEASPAPHLLGSSGKRS